MSEREIIERLELFVKVHEMLWRGRFKCVSGGLWGNEMSFLEKKIGQLVTEWSMMEERI